MADFPYSTSTPIVNRMSNRSEKRDDDETDFLPSAGQNLLDNLDSDDDEDSLGAFMPEKNEQSNKENVLACDSDVSDDSSIHQDYKSLNNSKVDDSLVMDSMSIDNDGANEKDQSLPVYNRNKDRSRSQLITSTHDSSANDSSINIFDRIRQRQAKKTPKIIVESDTSATDSPVQQIEQRDNQNLSGQSDVVAKKYSPSESKEELSVKSLSPASDRNRPEFNHTREQSTIPDDEESSLNSEGDSDSGEEESEGERIDDDVVEVDDSGEGSIEESSDESYHSDNSVVDIEESDEESEDDLIKASAMSSERKDPIVNQEAMARREKLYEKLDNYKKWKVETDLSKLPDKGAKLLSKLKEVQNEIADINANFQLPKRDDVISSKTKQQKSPVTIDLVESDDGLSESALQNGLEAAGPSRPIVKETASNQSPAYKRELMERLYSNAPVANRLYGGKMNEERDRLARTVTHDAIVKLHSSVTNLPAETEETHDPNGLLVELKKYQRQGLTWLLWRENQEPPGGILADDMGLGKTLSMISLILVQKQKRKEGKASDEPVWKSKLLNRAHLVSSHATLVVCPASVLDQWVVEIERRVKPGRLKVYAFKGPKNKRESNPHRLANYDVVVTSYQLVRSEVNPSKGKANKTGTDDDSFVDVKKNSSKSVLLRIGWQRIILDEAHNIKNHDSLQSKAICSLPAINRWCLTGTPIHNKLMDFYSLLRFLRCSPFDELAVWKTWIMQSTTQSRGRLNTLVKGLLLRRTKTDIDSVTGEPLLKLEERLFEKRELALNDVEKQIYEQLFKASQLRVKEFVKTQEYKDQELIGISTGRMKHDQLGYKNPFKGGARGPKSDDRFQAMTNILVMLLRLRQACVHLALTKEAVDIDALRDDANLGGDVAKEMAEMSLEEGDLTDSVTKTDKIGEVFEIKCLSTKLQSLMEEVTRICCGESADKCVIVSQWAKLLDIIEIHIRNLGIKFTRISGDVPTGMRQDRVDAFNKKNHGPRIMLLSLTAGGVGLNLIGGNHLFMLDLHWNPALEQQACDRIYRIGQTKKVYIYKFICKDTIEQRVLEMQEKKLELAKSVLEGAASKNMNKLTLGDLKFLFQLDQPKPKPMVPAPASGGQQVSADSRPPFRTIQPVMHAYSASGAVPKISAQPPAAYASVRSQPFIPKNI